MAGALNDVKSLTANGGTGILIKTGNTVIKSIHLTKNNIGDIAYFLDGTTANGTTQFTVEADSGAQIPFVNRTFANGCFVTFTGTTAKFVVTFE